MHRRLRFNPAGGFAHHEGNPMSGDVFVLDETSMVDSSLGCGWLRAIPSGSRVVFVGDVDQLPSVGPGDVLRDLINSGRIPVARLTKVHRQAEGSGIAQAAQAILAGRAPVSNDIAGNDFSFIKSEDNASIIRDLEKLIRHQLACGFSHKDIQILCPQKTGDVGTDALNNRLRWLLNPTSPNQHDEDLLVSTRGWCLGERLMQTKNNYELSVFNGDMGTVTDISGDGGLTLEMEDSRPVIYPKQATKDLTMGYAITVHKSQGGERPVILMPISPSHTFSLNRNLLYTGITRGKKQVCLVGSPRTAVVAAGKKDQTARLTGLVHEIDHVYESVGLKARRKPKSGFQPS
jgi:exodeoxyribonuclease V alpha subunit